MSLDGIYGMEGEYVTYFSRRAMVQRYRIPWIEQGGRAAIKYPLHPERSAGEGQGGALVTLDVHSLIRIPNHTATAQQKLAEKGCEKTSFSSAKTRCTAMLITSPLRKVFFSLEPALAGQWGASPDSSPDSGGFSAGSPC